MGEKAGDPCKAFERISFQDVREAATWRVSCNHKPIRSSGLQLVQYETVSVDNYIITNSRSQSQTKQVILGIILTTPR